MRERALPFRVGCYVAVLTGVAYLWSPAAARELILELVGGLAPLVIAVSTLLQRPGTRTLWRTVAFCELGWVLALAPMPWLASSAFGFVSWRDVLNTVCYGVIIVGILSAGRRLTSDLPGQAALDMGIFALGGLSVIWSFATGSQAGLHQIGLSWMTAPFFDVLAVIASARLVLIAGGQPSPSLLLLSLVLLTAGDLVNLRFALAGQGGRPGGPWFVAALLLSTLAALHPTMARFGMRARGGPRHMEQIHLLALALAAFMPPVMLLRERDTPTPVVATPLVLMSAAVFTLVIVRLERMMAIVDTQRVQLESLARTDPLTSLPNRRTGEAELARMLGEAVEQGVPLVAGLLDLDHFKAYNDEHGHPAGDRLLETVSSAWRRSLPPDVFLSRHGGEEFLLLARGRHPDNVRLLLEGLRGAHRTGQTFSAGAAAWDGLESGAALVDRADKALYRAKESGRDRIVVATHDVVALAAPDA